MIAVGRIDAGESLAAIFAAQHFYVEAIEEVLIFGIYVYFVVIPGALADIVLTVDFCPGVSSVAADEEPSVGILHHGEYFVGIGCGGGYVHGDPDSFRQTFACGKIRPGITSVRAFIDAAAFSPAFHAVGRAFDMPHAGV